jgi:hypothetical protein
MEHLERLENVSNCPTQFQEYIEEKDYPVFMLLEMKFLHVK